MGPVDARASACVVLVITHTSNNINNSINQYRVDCDEHGTQREAAFVVCEEHDCELEEAIDQFFLDHDGAREYRRVIDG